MKKITKAVFPVAGLGTISCSPQLVTGVKVPPVAKTNGDQKQLEDKLKQR